MVEVDVVYEGQLHCKATHGPSGDSINTDAPKDNQGRGEAFSPTDLVGAAMGTCMLTLIGIYAARHNLDISGATAHVTKEMVTAPLRRIGRLGISINISKPVPQDKRDALEKSALTCPVYASLHPDVEKVVTFSYA